MPERIWTPNAIDDVVQALDLGAVSATARHYLPVVIDYLLDECPDDLTRVREFGEAVAVFLGSRVWARAMGRASAEVVTTVQPSPEAVATVRKLASVADYETVFDSDAARAWRFEFRQERRLYVPT